MPYATENIADFVSGDETNRTLMKKNKKLEISDEMIGTTDGKSCSTAFADPFIKKTKRVKSKPVRKKQYNRKKKPITKKSI